jgi:hypothetical protein
VSELRVFRAVIEGDLCRVAGRCYAGLVRRSSVFCRAMPPPRDSSAPQRAEPLPVQLVVERISLYGKDVEELQEGLTAEIWMRGTGGDQLLDGWLLVDRSP